MATSWGQPIMPAAARLPAQAQARWARPTSAPPSGGLYVQVADKSTESRPALSEPGKAEQLKMPRGPVVREEGPLYDIYVVPNRDAVKPPDDRCSVTFTNLTDGEIRILVDAKTHAIAKGGSVQIPVTRQFVWRMEGRDPQNEQVRMGDYAVQIVIRR
jgi:hypothetical protein